jgi:hypothetical protein
MSFAGRNAFQGCNMGVVGDSSVVRNFEEYLNRLIGLLCRIHMKRKFAVAEN